MQIYFLMRCGEHEEALRTFEVAVRERKFVDDRMDSELLESIRRALAYWVAAITRGEDGNGSSFCRVVVCIRFKTLTTAGITTRIEDVQQLIAITSGDSNYMTYADFLQEFGDGEGTLERKVAAQSRPMNPESADAIYHAKSRHKD